MKKITILCSLYNSGNWLENRLHNLYQSTMIDDIDIWCVNANSADNRDREIPLDYIKYDNFHYEDIGQCSVYEAWNYIINKSESDYITNANTDDLVSPDCYEKLSSVLDGGNCDFSYPSWYTTSTPNLSWHEVTERKLSSFDGHPGNYNGNVEISGVGHFPMWRRSLHRTLGMLDGSFRALGDAEWWARCYYSGGSKFQWVNEPLACYLWREGQNGVNLWRREINDVEWKKYHEKVEEYLTRSA